MVTRRGTLTKEDLTEALKPIILLHYPHLSPGWRGVFTNKSTLESIE